MKKHLQTIPLFLLSFLLLFSSCGGGEGATLVKIGETSFSTAFCRYLTENFKQTLENGDPSFREDGANVERLKKNVLSSLSETAAVYHMAREFGVSADDCLSEAEEVCAAALENEYGGDAAKMEEALSARFMTKDLFIRLYALTLIEEDVFLYYTGEENGLINASDEIVRKDVEANFLHASQILILFEGRTKEEARARAEEALARVESGEDFNELVKIYCEDPAMLSNDDSYYFTKGEFAVRQFEETAASLRVGQTSGIVESDIGLHIVKRLPIEADYVDSHLEELRSSFKTRLFYEYKQQIADSLTVSGEDKLEELIASAIAEK